MGDHIFPPLIPGSAHRGLALHAEYSSSKGKERFLKASLNPIDYDAHGRDCEHPDYDAGRRDNRAHRVRPKRLSSNSESLKDFENKSAHKITKGLQ